MIPATFDKHPSSREFWAWAARNVPRHRELTIKLLSIKGEVHKAKRGGSFGFWKRLLDRLVQKGWPEYVMIWTSDDELVIFERYLLQGVRNEIRRSRVR